MPKIYSKYKASKTTKPLKLPEVLARLAYNIKIRLKRVLKTKVQPRGYLDLNNVVIYALYTKSRKNQGLVSVLFIF